MSLSLSISQQADPDKRKKIREYPIPRTVTDVKSFLGLASYYRRFVPKFAAIAKPLHDQTKDVAPPWTSETTAAFEKLKTALTEAPILIRPDFDKPFVLITDASRQGLGAVLSQLDDEKRERVVLYISRGLSSAEANYGISKLECLAVVWAVKQLRPYLLGKRFKILTDHSALQGLINQAQPTGILARWITFLAEFRFDIQHRPGKQNANADFLSRLGY